MLLNVLLILIVWDKFVCIKWILLLLNLLVNLFILVW